MEIFEWLILCDTVNLSRGFLGGSDGKQSARNAGDPGSIPGLGKSPGEGNSYPLQGIFPTQGSNPGLLYCRRILYQLSYEGSPQSKPQYPEAKTLHFQSRGPGFDP